MPEKEGLIAKIIYTLPKMYDWTTQFVTLFNWEKWQGRIFDDLTGKKILEIGVGPGRLYVQMAKRGFDVYGTEIRRGMADEARNRIEKHGLVPKIHYGSVYDVPFEDEMFDCIVMTFVLSEIRDLDRAIKEWRRVLKKNGKVICISVSYPQDNNLFARIILDVINKSDDFYLDRNFADYFRKHDFDIRREDFGPFYIINKIVARKK